MAQLAEKFQDTKRRTMGLDVDALDQQIADKRIQEQHNLQEELDGSLFLFFLFSLFFFLMLVSFDFHRHRKS